MVEHLPSMLEALGVSFVQLYALSPAEVAESPASLKDKLNMEERQQSLELWEGLVSRLHYRMRWS